MRKLASIQRITDIRPIEGADKIEVAYVLGWSVVVGKGEFAVGDLAVYFEIDSFLPASNPAFASFQDRFIVWNGKSGMRLKTIRLRKQVSQGLLMPINTFRELDIVIRDERNVGSDLTELLMIEKWEPAEEASGNGSGARAGNFPDFIRKTDQERVQNCISVLPKYVNDTFEVSIKLDGSSMTVFCLQPDSLYYKDKAPKTWWERFKAWAGLRPAPEPITGVCSRNTLIDPEGSGHFASYVREHNVLEALENFPGSIAVQGELIGPNIQGNYEKVGNLEWHVFDIYDIDKQCYLKPAAVRELADILGFAYVPVVDVEYQMSCHPTTRDLVDTLLAEAEGPGMNASVKREGLVFKSNESDFSFKAISQAYLLKKG